MKTRAKPKFYFLVFVALLCFVVGINAQNRKAKAQLPEKSAICKLSGITFPCPNEEYKVILNDNRSDIFLAQNTRFDYSVFVIAPKTEVEEQNFITEAKKTLLKTLYPTDSQDYRWKNVDIKTDKTSSKYEVGKNLSLGFNGDQTVTIEYRRISFKNKNLFIGTIVKGHFAGVYAEEEFNQSRYTTNGGCVDAQLIIQSITGENNSNKEFDFCNLDWMIIKKAN